MAMTAVVIVLSGSLTGPLSAGAASAQSAAGPPDGRIVYSGGTGQIYTIDPDGTAAAQLTRLPAGRFALQPVWFPDASRIVFVSNRGDEGVRLFVMRRDGTHVHRLVGDASGFNDWTPAVTPDGHTIIYSRCRPDPLGGCALFSVRANGTGRRALTQYRRGPDQPLDFWPDVSPDGSTVAFSRFESRGIASQVWLIGIDGSSAHALTPARLEASVPRWMPDGAHLLLTSNFQHLGEQIYRVSADGSGLHPLTHSGFPHNNLQAVPSPSGARIAFVSDRSSSQPFSDSDLLVMRADGRRKRSIAGGNIATPDWGTAPLVGS
jgi:Tol biopolymer transport system component